MLQLIMFTYLIYWIKNLISLRIEFGKKIRFLLIICLTNNFFYLNDSKIS